MYNQETVEDEPFAVLVQLSLFIGFIDRFSCFDLAGVLVNHVCQVLIPIVPLPA